jgi:hypothetical protein
MLQTIKPMKWLEDTLWLLGVYDIFENTTCQEANGGRIWMCSLSLDIPIRYNNQVRQQIVQGRRQSMTKAGAQLDTVHLTLQALERIGYCIPDWTQMKIQALVQRTLNVPLVTERIASYNLMDVVRRE